jgi:ferredoxin-type protein NapF
MMAPPRSAPHARGVHRFRRVFQVAFLVLFFTLLTLTVWPLGTVALGVFLGADPLIALNSAVNGAWLWPGWIAVALLALALVAGRVFCGYVCPTGTIIETMTPSAGPGRLSPVARNRLRAAPVFVLIGCAGLLLFASGAYLLFDPLAILTRTATVLIYPLLDRLLRLFGDAAYLASPLRPGVDLVTGTLTGRLIFARPLTYGLQLAVLGMFSAMLAISWLEPRMWCRDLCPLGALLGLAGRFAVVGRVVDSDACIACSKCAKACPMDAVTDDFLATDTSRCQSCYACADVCPVDAIHLGTRPARQLYSPTRRAALAAGGLSLLAGFFVFTGLSRRERNARLIRPPGGRDEDELLAFCSRCGQCMKVCPTNVLQPSVSEAGLEGVFTPQMDFRVGPCEWSCNECGKVCPTSAIRPLSLDAKRRTVIGRAYIDRNRCIPWADYKTCLVCQELCPVPEKAIIINAAEVTAPGGKHIKLGRPEVIAERCIGCGVCENACPVAYRAAIEVYATRPKGS